MKTISLDQIHIAPNRQRKHFDEGALRVFADSIATRGLLHPIILRQDEAGQFFLVAGERRLRAIIDMSELGGQLRHDGQFVPLGHIPYTLLAELDPISYEEAELEENTHRVDLSWQERALALTRLADLRTRQASARGEAMPSHIDLALEVRGSSDGVNGENTRRELIVAKYLDDPEVRGAATASDAFKILRKKEAATKARELGESVGRSFTADSHRAFNEDSLAWMRSAPAGQFDVILTDPHSGMGADEFGDSGGLAAGAHGYADTPELAQRCYVCLAIEGFRLAKPQAHAYVFCDIESFPWIKIEFVKAGWQVFRTPLIWLKRTAMRAPWPELGPQRKYETILYAIKGKKPILKMAGDVLDYTPDANLGHAAQKPVALYEDLLRRSCLPGDAVFDPFMGSGPIFPAAHGLKCRATGVEIDAASYGLALGRIAGLKDQLELPGVQA